MAMPLQKLPQNNITAKFFGKIDNNFEVVILVEFLYLVFIYSRAG